MKQTRMRSVAAKPSIKIIKAVNKKLASSKKKKLVDLHSPVKDTIAETISFVIKGKLTPIKSIVIEKKIDTSDTKAEAHNRKVLKKANQKPIKVKKVKEEITKPKSKVQSKTAKKTAQTNSKKKLEKTVVNLVVPSTKENSKRVKLDHAPPEVKRKPKTKGEKPKVKKAAPKQRTIKTFSRKPKTSVADKVVEAAENTQIIDEDEIKKQKTIEQLLKQVNEEIKSKKSKHKSNKIKRKKDLASKEKSIQIPNEKPIEKPIDLVSPVVDSKDDILLQKEIKSELIELAEECLAQNPQEITETIVEQLESKLEDNSKDEPPRSPKTKKKFKKLKATPNVTVLKKRLPNQTKNKTTKLMCKTKLFKFWNGPKRHRVASLNALAKVHCLYENETRGNILDIIDESTKVSYMGKKDSGKSKTSVSIKSEDVSDDSSPPPTRTLRSAPGLRGVGKHWEMHDSSSSDEDDRLNLIQLPIKTIKKEKITQPKPKVTEQTPTPKKRKSNEQVMDLKDMVVRKRMASLNATAILAASYSPEKRQGRSKDSQDDTSSCTSNSSDEYYAAVVDKEIKQEELDKKDDDKLIEVHTTPNKKVAVILNQDTDVTITGVYVNSTTRSTHHEGYCSIAGMQYRISATSHTQTAATAVATETVLQSSSSSGPDNSNSDSMPSSKSYTPLDALSNMQPPPGPGVQHNHPVLHGQQQMGPPQHVLPLPAHQLSPGLRHGCSSAFSSPHSTPGYQIPPGHNPPIQGDSGFVHGK